MGRWSPTTHPPSKQAQSRRLEDRLRIVAAQILRYRHLYGLPPEMEAVARALRDGAPGKSQARPLQNNLQQQASGMPENR